MRLPPAAPSQVRSSCSEPGCGHPALRCPTRSAGVSANCSCLCRLGCQGPLRRVDLADVLDEHLLERWVGHLEMADFAATLRGGVQDLLRIVAAAAPHPCVSPAPA